MATLRLREPMGILPALIRSLSNSGRTLLGSRSRALGCAAAAEEVSAAAEARAAPVVKGLIAHCGRNCRANGLATAWHRDMVDALCVAVVWK